MSNWDRDAIYQLRNSFSDYADKMFKSSMNGEPVLIEPHHCNMHSYVEGFIDDMLQRELATCKLEEANSTPTIRE